jgi:hypothetical protein
VFVVVAGDWPGGLELLHSLDVHIQDAFFPSWFHGLFNSSKYRVTFWCSVVDFQGVEVGNDDVIYIILGSIDFLRHMLPALVGCQQVIVTMDVTHHGASRSALQ